MNLYAKVIVVDTGEVGRIVGFDGTKVVVHLGREGYRVRSRTGLQLISRWYAWIDGGKSILEKIGLVVGEILGRAGNVVISALIVAVIPTDWPGLY